MPKSFWVAVSGGSDSMALLSFFQNCHFVKIAHFNHGTDFGNKAEALVRDYAERFSIPIKIGRLSSSKPKRLSEEEFFREERYKFFDQLENGHVVTAHTLDDAVETWIFTSLHGNARLIPAERGRFLRPAILNRKKVLLDWVERHNIPYLEDPSNKNICYMRNFIRHELLPKTLQVNPGLYKVIKKKYLNPGL